MTFCTFKTDNIIPTGTVVQKNGILVVPNDNNSEELVVGIVIKSYSSSDGETYSEVHLGGGVIQATLIESWDGNWSPITILGEGIKPASTSDKYHGYLIPSLPPVQKSSGDSVDIYWRGVI